MWDASRRPSRIPMMDITRPVVSVRRRPCHLPTGIRTCQQTITNVFVKP